MESSTQIINSTIDLAKGDLLPGSVTGTAAVHISNLQIAVDNGDITIGYELSDLEEDQYYEVLPVIKLNGQRLLLAADEFRGDFGRPLSPGTKKITWLNPLERYINLSGELEVELRVNQWGEQEFPYDCELGEPTFTGRQKRPYLLAAGLGAASIGAGQLFRNRRDDTYDQYQSSETLAEATPYYEDANSQHHTYLILTWAGAGILAIDAAMYLIRQNKYKKDLRNYETYCNPNRIGFQPVIELPARSMHPNGSVGFKLTLPIGGN
ncbi:hypothetical protein [Flavilitoribacter nigricans]|uniref:Uncharacterized protein n=1 Tax=Flavilitoribacter nigricans (strain ATCC 23147 / DSM 23189 / NBRC 102662 / NCIMB 1420 / SS-2) TaxID=1122177 RepID=A0A2D0MXB5_FLAN2|nr:hypothetical protein [Flavilitoribacter nigricans]PHN00894.1 hypothetical protein CRP01_39840 [Flavilitoribacter nigricans DSM 23189 = NBRC 102662]